MITRYVKIVNGKTKSTFWFLGQLVQDRLEQLSGELNGGHLCGSDVSGSLISEWLDELDEAANEKCVKSAFEVLTNCGPNFGLQKIALKSSKMQKRKSIDQIRGVSNHL